MAPKIFIDGAQGTTGLVIADLLQPLVDAGKVELISIADRHNDAGRRAAYEQADLTVLCLPDGEARHAMTLMEGTTTRVLDASSAHRTDKGWVYGLPELDAHQPDLIREAKYVSNPGCFATGAIVLLHPLIEAGLLDKEECVTLFGVAGYSAGGKEAIARHESREAPIDPFAAVSLNAPHKHVAEIQTYAGLATPPLFVPNVVHAPRGMMVSAVFNRAALKGGIDAVRRVYKETYRDMPDIHVEEKPQARLDFSRFAALNEKEAQASAQATLDIHVNGWEKEGGGEVRVTALFDNLGKGAGTQAVQNIKLMFGL
jgi:N-acetyl-gamma-glutamyl-phosphate reductase